MGDLTIGAELVSNNNSACCLTGGYGGSTTTYYRKNAIKPGEIGLSAFNVASSTVYFPLIAFEIPSSEVGKTISFSFKNPFIYEGAFTNPPYKESLDCSPTNPFFLNSFYKNYYSYYARQYISTSGWKRVFMLPDYYSGSRLAFYGKILIIKEYIHNLTEHYIVNFSIYDVPPQTTTKGYFIEPLYYGSLNTAAKYITKFRFAKDPNTSRIYLEYYYKNTDSNAIRIYMKDFMYETFTLADSLGTYPDETMCNEIFKKGLISDQTTVTNDVLIGSEVNTIVKTTSFTEPV